MGAEIIIVPAAFLLTAYVVFTIVDGILAVAPAQSVDRVSGEAPGTDRLRPGVRRVSQHRGGRPVHRRDRD